MTQNYFQGTIQNPYHISTGAVVKNAEGNICCHYFDSITVKSIGTLENFYLLMRETIEPNETIEQCLSRGLMEEFGITATLNRYVGSIVSKFLVSGTDVEIEKTTLYFLCDFVSIDESLRKKEDVESASEIRWMEPTDLIVKMKEQGKRLGRSDADESVVIENVSNMTNVIL